MYLCISHILCNFALVTKTISLSMGFFDFFSKDKKQNLDKGLEKTKEGYAN